MECSLFHLLAHPMNIEGAHLVQVAVAQMISVDVAEVSLL